MAGEVGRSKVDQKNRPARLRYLCSASRSKARGTA